MSEDAAIRHQRPRFRVQGGWASAATDVRPMYWKRDVGSLKRVVAEGDSIAACDAIQALEDLRDASAADLLLWCIENPAVEDIGVQAAAARALGTLREPRAVPLLIKLLRFHYSNMTHHQEAAAWALGQIGDPSSDSALLEAVSSSGFASTVLDALGSRGPVVGHGLLAESRKIWNFPDLALACVALGRTGHPDSIPYLASFLEGTPEPHGFLFRQDRDSIPAVRRGAARGLGLIADPRAVPALVHALRDVDDETSVLAATSLLSTPEGRQALWTVVTDDESVTARIVACEVVTEPTAVQVRALEHALRRDSSGSVRRAAARAVGRLGLKELIIALLEALSDSSSGDAAAQAMVRLASPPILPLIELVRAGGAASSRAATTLGGVKDARVVPALLGTLGDSSHTLQTRAGIIDALGAQADPAAIPALLAVLADSEESNALRARAARSLASLEDAAATAMLISATADDSEGVAVEAIAALGRRSGRSAAQTILALARSASPGARKRAALMAAAHLDPAPCGELRDLMPLVGSERSLLVQALGRCGDGDTIQLLGSMACDLKDRDQMLAISALARIGRAECVEPLYEALWSVRRFEGREASRASAEALVALGRPEADAALFRPHPREATEPWSGDHQALRDARRRVINRGTTAKHEIS